METIFPFSEENILVGIAYLKITSNSIKIELPHVFSIRILMLPCRWPLIESRFWMTFPISSAENVTVDRPLSVI